MPEIIVEDVSMVFKGNIVALEDVNLHIEDGSYSVLLGPSGCGKTTLLRVISGLLFPTKGTVKIDGVDVTKIPIEERGKLGFVFQHYALFPHMNVEDNIGYSPWIEGLEDTRIREIRTWAKDQTKLIDDIDRYPSELSGGDTQKVALARALATESKILFLDEPLSALDAHVSTELRYDLRNIAKELGLTVLHVTHDQDEALSVADQLIILRAGRVVETGTPEELYNIPQRLFTANFLGESNFLEGTVVQKDPLFVKLRDDSEIRCQPASIYTPRLGDTVVITFRPNTPKLIVDEKPYFRGILENLHFIGTHYRVQVLLQTLELIECDLPTNTLKNDRLEIGIEVGITLNPKRTLCYQRPLYGLREELKLE
ncbi:MAG: ABC transporter ATP-binding protein [Promethearchaeota archaeon]